MTKKNNSILLLLLLIGGFFAFKKAGSKGSVTVLPLQDTNFYLKAGSPVYSADFINQFIPKIDWKIDVLDYADQGVFIQYVDGSGSVKTGFVDQSTIYQK